MTNTFHLLVGAEAFLRELTHSLAGCHQSLYAQFMTFEGDASGQAFADLLAHKAADGLDVRLMVDGYTDVVISDVYPILVHRLRAVRQERASTQAIFNTLRAHGVGVKRTAPPGRFGCFMLYRNHKKMVVLDERVAFVGGINISDHNYNWHDFMVKIEGPLVQDLVHDFCSTWDGSTIPLDKPVRGGDYILNQCAGRYAIFYEILDLIGQVERTLVIESPYLLGDHIEAAILAAARRGVQVKLILPGHSNKLMYRIWVRKLRRRLAHPNIIVCGYQGNGGMTHAKLVIGDDQWATFGSLNMIELEGLTQKELNVFTSSADLIAQLGQLVEHDLAHSVPLPPPLTTFGRFTYNALYLSFAWWTKRLLRSADWKALYC